jgi:hypothetical protein
MSIRHATKPQHLGPGRLKPDRGTRTLRASVEATGRATDLCTGHGPRGVARERILVWLAEGAREVSWALCSLPRERWAVAPPSRLTHWPALRHVRHLALREAHVTLCGVRRALGEVDADNLAPSALELEQLDAAWDAASALESAEALVSGLGATRFELLQRLEAAPDDAWERPIPATVAPDPSSSTDPVQLDWLLLHARQHELEHVAAIWRLALNWDRTPRIPIHGVPLHPADRLEESH